jgi:hypothetical protein
VRVSKRIFVFFSILLEELLHLIRRMIHPCAARKSGTAMRTRTGGLSIDAKLLQRSGEFRPPSQRPDPPKYRACLGASRSSTVLISRG